ncbi:hypothetical protein M514_19258 [Trichuris suis]|uniref:Uncharacterized protein n=1 Tax=Trichuris suis TaxID=68888 RepID=A0A085NGM9_9BILA|nr:hypothetical protein M514_19258 [Trichuris suis]
MIMLADIHVMSNNGRTTLMVMLMLGIPCYTVITITLDQLFMTMTAVSCGDKGVKLINMPVEKHKCITESSTAKEKCV